MCNRLKLKTIHLFTMVSYISVIVVVVAALFIINKWQSNRIARNDKIVMDALIAEQNRQVIMEDRVKMNRRIDNGVYFDNGWVQLQPDNSYPYINSRDIIQINKLYEAKF